MQFKTDELISEWLDERLKTDVKAIVYAAVGRASDIYPNLKARITAVYYQKGQYGSQTSVHEEWRGVDMSLVGSDVGEADTAMKELTQWLNDTFFIPGADMKVAVYHTTGYGWHIHIQVSRMGGTIILRRTGILTTN